MNSPEAQIRSASGKLALLLRPPTVIVPEGFYRAVPIEMRTRLEVYVRHDFAEAQMNARCA